MAASSRRDDTPGDRALADQVTGGETLRGVTLADGRRADVTIDGATISSVVDPSTGDDWDGYLLLSAAVEPHAHLDKAFLADVVTNETGDLYGAIAAMEAARGHISVDDIAARAERAARLMAANGYRAVRSHADVTLDSGLVNVEALLEVRQRVADVIDMQIVTLAGHPVSGAAGADLRVMLEDALAMGADLVGGCPHLEPDGTHAATEVLLGLAAAHGVGVDLHTDETIDPDVDGLNDLAALVTSSGFEHPVTASHCVSLGMRPEAEQRRIAEAVAAAGISVIALPATNLFLQGRSNQSSMPRGVTAVKALRDAGVTVAAGADNLHDPFNPFGRACPFETAALMVWTTHRLPSQAWAFVTDEASRAIGLEPGGVVAGGRADLIAVRAGSLREAIAFGPPDRVVWRAGRRLARAGDRALRPGEGHDGLEQHVGPGGDVVG